MEINRGGLLPIDPDDHVFYDVPVLVLPPKEAYYYLCPDRNLIRTTSNKKAGERKMFNGWNNLTVFELAKL